MNMKCVDYVDLFYPFDIEPSWRAMIEEWCATGTHPWVVAFASLRMLLRTGPRASTALTADERKRWEELIKALMRKKAAKAETEAQYLCGGRPFELDLWISLVDRLKVIYSDYDEAFLAYLFEKFTAAPISVEELVEIVKIYKVKHPSRALTL
ncbi:hypothetical protein [Lysobacter capsici]|uniref:hypothetical protein n=1 Tax=Lysobacter capsici TaxID=435897 RepID=UPI0011DEFF1C|nr:hypothetical protein [Lysobacter capsici]